MSLFSLSCFSLNVRGIRDITKRKALFLFCKAQKKDVYFLQETHSGQRDETFWRNQRGGKALFCHSSNHSGGIMTLFDCGFNGSIIESHFSSEGRWMLIVIKKDGMLFILANIYGYSRTTQNK